MTKTLLALLALSCVGTVQAAGKAPAPRCKVAEVNPVTNHVECVDPYGAPVAAPSSSAVPPCPDSGQDRKDWSIQRGCGAAAESPSKTRP